VANICKSTLTMIGLTEAPETFAKAASKIMFGIDLDDMDPKQWGEDLDGESSYVTRWDAETKRTEVVAGKWLESRDGQ
jgi:hypothetical protein